MRSKSDETNDAEHHRHGEPTVRPPKAREAECVEDERKQCEHYTGEDGANGREDRVQNGLKVRRGGDPPTDRETHVENDDEHTGDRENQAEGAEEGPPLDARCSCHLRVRGSHHFIHSRRSLNRGTRRCAPCGRHAAGWWIPWLSMLRRIRRGQGLRPMSSCWADTIHTGTRKSLVVALAG